MSRGNGRPKPIAFNAQDAANVLKKLDLQPYLLVAADAAGVPRRTIKSWSTRGQRGVEPFATWWQAVAQKRAERVELWIRELEEVEKDSAKRSAREFLLERADPQEFGRIAIKEAAIQKLRDDLLEELLDQVEHHMSPEAYGELINAVGRVVGLLEPEEAPRQSH